jgi:hypothetical protein
MAVGIAGDTASGLTIANYPYQQLQIVELRTISNLLLNLLGQSEAQDELRVLRNDQAFDLGVAQPVVGS